MQNTHQICGYGRKLQKGSVSMVPCISVQMSFIYFCLIALLVLFYLEIRNTMITPLNKVI